MLKRAIRGTLHRLQRWLADDPAERSNLTLPFDNRYDWLSQAFGVVGRDPIAARRPAYVWGVLQGAALARVLGYDQISVIEFGVAGGAGLISMERIAEATERLVGISIDVYGFDTGIGIPKSMDYRDCPNIWLNGQFPMDSEGLRARLNRAKLVLGRVEETVPAFSAEKCAPVAFVSFDLDLYTATRSAFQIFDSPFDRLLPRVVCYFDDIIGLTYSEFNGERLAINEFNSEHGRRKVSPLYGLRCFLPFDPQGSWPELLYFAHFFDHPRYCDPDELRKPMTINLERGDVTDWVEIKR
jgi:hypothetical protein